MFSDRFQNAAKVFIPLFVFSIVFTLVVFWAVQQNYRLSANDPQIQLSEDTAMLLSQGGSINFTPGNKIEISRSLSTYIMIYNSDKKLISYSGVLHGKPANLPKGVFDSAKNNGQNKFTWQPENNVRSAVVLTYYKNGSKEGYVLAGRSLRETEMRENLLTLGVFGGWLIAIILSFASLLVIS